MIGGFLACPRAICNVAFLPILVDAGKFLRAENVVIRDDEKRCVGDGVVGPFGFDWGVFVVVYDDLGSSRAPSVPRLGTR